MFTLIEVRIGGLLVEAQDLLSFERNMQEERDFADIKILSSRKERYETYDKVELKIDEQVEQYLVQSDVVTAQREGLFEHLLTLTENMSFFDTIYPADRSFRIPGQTLGQVLNAYKREIEHFHNIEIDFVDGDYLDALMPQKEFTGVNFSVVLTDLFRRIDSIPKANYLNGKWEIFPISYTFKNELIEEVRFSETQVLDSVTYATKVKSQIKNGLYEGTDAVWFPSETGYVLPRSSSLQFIESNLRYELDSPIIDIEQVIVVDVKLRNEFTQFQFNTDVDITEQVVNIATYETLSSLTNLQNFFGDTFTVDNTFNVIPFTPGSRFIENLFIPSGSRFLGLTRDAKILQNAISRAYRKNVEPNIIHTVQDDTQDIKIRIKYRPQRDLDISSHKQFIGVMNESGTINNQRDSAIEISQYKKNMKNLANRMGNVKISGSRIFDFGERLYQIGDFTEDDLVITRVRNTLHNDNYILCEYELNENYANIDSEYTMSREPYPYTVTTKRVTTNLVDEDYVLVSEEFFGFGGRLLKEGFDNVLKILQTNPQNVKQIELGIFKPDWAGWFPERAIAMPVLSGGDGNSLSFHVFFNDVRTAGFKRESAPAGFLNLATAEFQQPILYTRPDGTLENFNFYFTPEVAVEDDGNYPMLMDNEPFFNNSLSVNTVFEPVNLDVGAAFAFSYILHFVSRHKHIIIGDAFSRRNYLITDPPSQHNFQIFKSDKPYNIYDQKPRAFDQVANVAFLFQAANNSLTFIPSEAVEHFALVKNGEILLAFNKALTIGQSYTIFITLSKTPIDFGAQRLLDANLSTIAPYYSSIQTQVVFVTLGGQPAPDNLLVDFGDVVQEPVEKPIREGFVFTGWDTQFPLTITELQTIVTAEYIEVTTLQDPSITTNAPYYEDTVAIVVFNVGDAEPKPDDYEGKVGDVVQRPAVDPQLEGFVFGGWSEEFPFTITQTVTQIDAILIPIQTLPTPNITTKAPYYIQQNVPEVFYSVQFDVGGGVALFDQLQFLSVQEGTVIDYPGDAQRDGSVFLDWNTTFPLTVTDNIFITAIYQDVQELDDPDIVTNAPYFIEVNDFVEVTFVDFDDSVIETQFVVVGEDATVDDPTRTGFTFTGWDKPLTNLTDDVTIKATYEIITYSITYVMNGGTNNPNNPSTYTVQSPTINLANPSRTGFTFVEWSPTNTIPSGSTGNKTFTAQWSVITYSITYNLDGGTNNPSNPSTYNITQTPITILAASKSGHCFTGWSPTNTIPSGGTGNRTFTASFTPQVALTAPFRVTSPPTSVEWNTITVFASHNNPNTISLRVTLWQVDANDNPLFAWTSATNSVASGATSQFTFSNIPQQTRWRFAYRATASGCFIAADTGVIGPTFVTPQQPQTFTPSTGLGNRTARSISFTVTNNDSSASGTVTAEIREASTSGTVIGSFNQFINAAGQQGATVELGIDNAFFSQTVNPSTTYWLVNPRVTVTNKRESEMGTQRSWSTLALPALATPSLTQTGATGTTITFNATNNESGPTGEAVDIWYDVNRNPDASSQKILDVTPGNSKPGSLSFLGDLVANETYNVRAFAVPRTDNKVASGTTSVNMQTAAEFRTRVGLIVNDGTSRFTTITYTWSDIGAGSSFIGTGTPQTIRTFTPTGTSITITAPESFTSSGITYFFGAWKVNGANQASGQRTITTTITANTDLQAEYAALGGF